MQIKEQKILFFLIYQIGKDDEIWLGCEETDILIYCWEYLAISIKMLNAHMLECSDPLLGISLTDKHPHV